MLNDSRHGLIAKQTLTPDEIAEISRLIDICNEHDRLRMRIGLEMLRERRGDETNDFLYYAGGQLVGYLEADSYGRKEKELTGMVHPDFRRQGISQRFSRRLKRNCNSAECRNSSLSANINQSPGERFLPRPARS